MPWHPTTLLSFKAIPFDPVENEYQGPWNGILTTLFPPDSEFVVAPQCYRPNNNKVADFTVMFDIKFKNNPVLIVELFWTSVLNNHFSRQEADGQIRERFRDCRDRCPISTLRGIVVMGTQMSFYSLDLKKPQAFIIPHYTPRDPDTAEGVVPREQWSLDVLSEEGEAEIRRVVGEIKAECAALG